MTNPYVWRNTVRDPAMFFGRADELNRLFALLANGQSVSIIGDRRIGKSSLLYCAGLPEAQARTGQYDFSGCLFVHIDLQGSLYREPTALLGHFLRQMRRQSAGRLPTAPLQPAAPDDFEEAIFRLNRQRVHVIFLLDEFDCVTMNQRLDAALFSFLRYMAANYDLSLVVVSHRRLAELCHAEIMDSPFFNIFALISLDALTETAARDLIAIPSQRYGRSLAPHADWLLDLAGTQPLFLQIACFYLLEAYRQGEPVDLARVADRFYQEAVDHFTYAWDHAGETTRRQWQADSQRESGPYGHYLTAGRAFRQFVGEQTAVSPAPLPIQTADVEAALEHLWDTNWLAGSPLVRLPGVQHYLAQNNLPPIPPNQGKALHHTLRAAIDHLQAGRSPDKTSKQWRGWHILTHKYVQEEANRPIYLYLNLSERTFYRERKEAIKAVTAVLGQLVG
ncbi:MAG TPA: ATP-binding protein [Anaerolineae bacterium]|nr:ATP-binding protein [Anaerolineae bacterium]